MRQSEAERARRGNGATPRYAGGLEVRVCRQCRRETQEFRCERCRQPTERTRVFNGGTR